MNTDVVRSCMSQALIRSILREIEQPPVDARRSKSLCNRLAAATGRQPQDPSVAREVAQAIRLASLCLELTNLRSSAGRLVDRAAVSEQTLIGQVLTCAASAIGKDDDLARQIESEWRRDASIELMLSLYEIILGGTDRRCRSTRGVYYTPASLTSFVVRSVDRLLREEFSLSEGLIHCSPFVRILDPAAGSGAFLLAVIEQMHHGFLAKPRARPNNSLLPQPDWQKFVDERLFDILSAQEIMLPAGIVATIAVAAKLQATGVELDRASGSLWPRLVRLVRIGNALTASPQSAAGEPEPPFNIILGNPPYRGISANSGKWINNLLRGRDEQANVQRANYFEVDGLPLGERKHWLQDDYVKFMRLAQWHVERAGSGIVGLVTSHGYLDNVTFRGMRQQLTKTFPRISVIDLHGNRKQDEVAPGGHSDENLFEIEQGIAIGLFRRSATGGESSVTHGELWGPRSEKQRQLMSQGCTDLATRRLEPKSPFYFFVPRSDSLLREYQRGAELTEVMPIHCTLPVTARDRFVIDRDRRRLSQRLVEFADLSIDDDVIRQRYFNNSRSTKYPPGDTRGWKLGAARRRLAGQPDWQRWIKRCWYRPFDPRFVFWSGTMIDWPRSNVVDHLRLPDNLVLISRRQMLPSRECNFFWIADDIPIDGLIRSDNRGTETMFPLRILNTASVGDGGLAGFNLAAAWLTKIEADLGLKLSLNASEPGSGRFTPEDVLLSLYATFFSVSYRLRYADLLRVDYPRVFRPRSSELFWALRDAGRRLVDCHLLRNLAPHRPPTTATGLTKTESVTVARSYPRWLDGQVWLNRETSLVRLDAADWEFRVGGYQVLAKWLKDRIENKRLTQSDTRHYSVIVAAVGQTRRQMQQIDREIEQAGGWPAAFAD